MQRGLIQTKSLFTKPDTSDGFRALICLTVPRVKIAFDSHMPELAPSQTLLTDYKGWKGKDPITWDEYVRRFKKEMKSEKSRQALHVLAERIIMGEIVTLLCWEGESNPHCHRHIVKSILAGLVGNNSV